MLPRVDLPNYTLSLDQINFLQMTQDASPVQVKEDLKSELPKIWKFVGCYPFQSKYLPFNLARDTCQKLKDFGNDVFGVILPYPGFDNEPNLTLLDQKFLHLFNVGETEQLVSGTVDGVTFTDIEVYSKKRIVLTLDIQ